MKNHLNCPDCGNELVPTPNREKLKNSEQWYNCDSCKTTWKIYKAIVFYHEHQKTHLTCDCSPKDEKPSTKPYIHYGVEEPTKEKEVKQ